MAPLSASGVRPTDLSQVLAAGTPDALESWLEAVTDPGERTGQLALLEPDERRRLGDLLDADTGEELVSTLQPHAAGDLLIGIAPARAGIVLDALNSDHAAEVLRELEPAEREPLLAAVPLTQANVLHALLAWPDDAAAAHMVPEVLTVAADAEAAEAVAGLRAEATHRRIDSQSGGYVYAVDGDRRLVGVLAFRDLVLAPAGTPVSELMDPDVLAVAPLDDSEHAARTLREYRLLAIPVVDAENRLLGVLTADAAADIAAEEATEDAELQGGSQPLDTPYLRASPWLLWRKRIVWLLILFVASAYTATVMQIFEDELDAVVALAFFIPLLIGTGGNTGTQITTTLVRAIATGQVRMRDVGRVLSKEMTSALLVALTMAITGLIRAFLLGVGWAVVLTVVLTIVAIVLWSAFVASILPLVLKKTRVDPAVASAPMISTIVDGTGLVIYFLIAKALLPELAGL
ncbi:MAG: magnesium transporter [Microbacterium sp.]|uniref:magnesium transporter n=1 Tax=Microbacterium sp. TaxID=51671 RepID=UPI003A876885